MSSLSIPSQWLRPEKFADSWRFYCSTNFIELVRSNRAGRFLREVLNHFETAEQIFDYHVKIRQNPQQKNRFTVTIHFGTANHRTNPPPIAVCISCEPSHELGVASLLSEQQFHRAWLDGKSRPRLIITPIRHVQRWSDLTDEDGEMDALWRDAVELIDRECDPANEPYPDIVFNQGTCRNHEHLHLKIALGKETWDRCIVPRHHEQIQAIARMSQQTNVMAECFPKQQWKKRPKQEHPEKDSDVSTLQNNNPNP
jgi:diadenosine tetraphosphate (Ap4A) HIT family hydrolase